MKTKIGVLDTTLRDGAQSALVSYTVKDKLKILDILDALGIGFAEGGAPAAITKDEELFAYLSSIDVERIYSARDFYDVGRNGISLYSDKKEIDIKMDDSLLLINDFEKNREEAYQIRSGVDWQYIGRLMEDHS